MAKKYNKSRKQKPNYSKRGKGKLDDVETASEFSLGGKIVDNESISPVPEQFSSPPKK